MEESCLGNVVNPNFITPLEMYIMSYIQTLSGNKFYFDRDPVDYFAKLSDAELIDELAGALSKVCRFAGHCKTFYSVATHCALGVPIPSRGREDRDASEVREYGLSFLFHDAAEAYTGDITTPLKLLIPNFKEIEKGIEDALFSRLTRMTGMASPHCNAIKRADLIMLHAEKCLLMDSTEEWAVLSDLSEEEILCSTAVQVGMSKIIEPISDPTMSKKVFLEVYKDLTSC